MYEEQETKINWSKIIKKVLILIGALLIILALVTLISRCSKRSNTPKPEEKVNLSEQLDKLEDATLKYLNKDNLPIELGSSKTIRLKVLENKELIKNLKDSKNNKCDPNQTYSEVLRLENHYEVKMTVSCGSNKDTRIIYVGCFENCNGGICKGEETSTNGICTEAAPKEEENKPSSNETTTPVVNPNNNTTKPSTTKPNKKPTADNTSNNTNTNKQPKKTTLYEFRKKVITGYSCDNKGGSLVNTDKCISSTSKTLYGTVIKTGGNTIYNYTYEDKKINTTYSEKYFNDTITAYNEGYTELISYSFKKGYLFRKYTTRSYCARGTEVGNKCKIATPITTPIKYDCKEDGYKYKNNQCTKVEPELIYVDADPVISYKTTWSQSPTLTGWERTGNTKQE